MSREVDPNDALEGKRRVRFKDYAWSLSHSEVESERELISFLHGLE